MATTAKTDSDPRARRVVRRIDTELLEILNVKRAQLVRLLAGEESEEIDERLGRMDSEDYGRYVALRDVRSDLVAAFKLEKQR